MMDDPGDLYFSFDEEEEAPEDTLFDEVDGDNDGGKPKTPRNRTFIIAVIALAFISLAAIGILAYVYLFGGGGIGQVSDNELTNQANMTLFASTQTAEYQTQTAPEEDEPAVEPTAEPIEVEDAEEAGEGEPTQVAQVETPTAEAPVPTATGSSIIIQVTPLGGEEDAAAAEEEEGDPAAEEDDAEPSEQPTLEPVTTLPDTGLFDTGSYGIYAIITVVLLGVIIGARQLRKRD